MIFGKDNLNLKGYKEFEAEHRASGWNAWLTFARPSERWRGGKNADHRNAVWS
jgi:hypothetical protein